MKSEEEYLRLLLEVGGYYRCPKDRKGNRLGPLVGYVGRYDGIHQFVGDEYVNFAMMERNGLSLHSAADGLLSRVAKRNRDFSQNQPGFCAAPEGGKALAVTMSQISGEGYIFPEKKVTAVATESSREVSKLVFDRHEPREGEKWWIVEDVCNNFSTTDALITLIEKFGARVVGILCFLNWSPHWNDVYRPNPDLDPLPIISLVRKPIAQYQQDDPTVADDIARGNVVWKPKPMKEWEKLQTIMADNA